MIKLKPITAALLLVVGCSANATTMEDRIAELEAQLLELKSMVEANQDTITVHATSISNNSEEIEEVRPARKGTSFKYGGFVQLDMLASSYSQGRPSNNLIEDFLVPSLIPVEPAAGPSDNYESTNLHAKSSRFYFTTSTPTDAGTISTRIELDHVLSAQGNERISNSWSSRMRHAFVKWEYGQNRSLMAGQSWSTFFNVSALPNLIDFVGPVGTLFNRQPQIRWTSGGLQLALENPATRLNQHIDGVNSTRLDDAETMPDLVARYNGKAGDLNWSLSGIARELAYEARASSAVEIASDSAYGYGLSLSGKWSLSNKNDLRFMLNYGDALGRYLGLNAYNDGYIDENGKIQTIDQLGIVLAYQHHWTPKWRSTFSLSATEADNPDLSEFAGADSLAKAYQSFHVNLNYLPAPRLQLGGEFIYANKELENGRDGGMSRLQFAMKYAF